MNFLQPIFFKFGAYLQSAIILGLLILPSSVFSQESGESGQSSNSENILTNETVDITEQRIVSQEERDIIMSDLKESGKLKKKPVFVVIPFAYEGITENSSIVFGDRYSENIKKLSRFESISPKEILEYLNDANPNLLDCSDVDCGLEIARIFEADFLIRSSIKLTPDNTFQIKTEIYQTVNRFKEFEDFLVFPKDDIYENLYRLSQRIDEHIPLIGRVVSSGKKKVMIDLGSNDGIRVDELLVLHRDELFDFDEVNESPYKMEAAQSIIRINRVEPQFSEGLVYIAKDYDEPVKNDDKVRYYKNRLKQIEQVEQARKEIDIYSGWDEDRKKEEEIIEDTIIPIPLPTYERNEWIRKVRHWEGERDFFQYMLWGSIGATLLTFYFYDPVSYLHLIPIGFTIYSTYAMLYSRNELDELIEEGKYKNYIRIIGDSDNIKMFDLNLGKGKDQLFYEKPGITLYSFNMTF